ncbi:hypothetical protein RIF29_05229 [Crotalaria pallida]|uniref:Uncharacterized protein n=1 Tax=Crotalaria pallida TaxID=3830 RepID=A0AAN9J2U7_CROPI
MVSVQTSYNVIPSEPTPTETLFSLCEQVKLRTHAPLLFVYKPLLHNKFESSSSSSTFNLTVQNLKNSLSQVLTIYYPLAGRLSLINERGQWEIHCNAKGAKFLGAYCEKSLDDLHDFVPTQLVSHLIPSIDYDVPIEEIPMLAVQLTRFTCGGYALGVALCRAAIDGSSTVRFMNMWAKLARGVGLLDRKEITPCHDRTALDSRKKESCFDHAEFYPPPTWVGKLIRDRAVVVVEVVKLTTEQIKKLKKKASYELCWDQSSDIRTSQDIWTNSNSNEAGSQGRQSSKFVSKNVANSFASAPYSTFEVVAGHLWRCASKARYEGNGEQPTRLSTLVNCKNRMKPPLPSDFAGNAVFPTVTPTCSFNDIMNKPLSYAAGNVREALERVTDEFVSSALDHIAKEKDMDLVRYNIHYPAPSVMHMHKGPFKGNPNLCVVSWMNFAFKVADFGFGEPVHFGPGFMDSEGKAFVINNANGDGVIVAIALDAYHMDAFKKLFYDEDMEEVFPASKL